MYFSPSPGVSVVYFKQVNVPYLNTSLLDFYCDKYDIVIIYDFAIRNMIFQKKLNLSEQINFRETYNT